MKAKRNTTCEEVGCPKCFPDKSVEIPLCGLHANGMVCALPEGHRGNHHAVKSIRFETPEEPVDRAELLRKCLAGVKASLDEYVSTLSQDARVVITFQDGNLEVTVMEKT